MSIYKTLTVGWVERSTRHGEGTDGVHGGLRLQDRPVVLIYGAARWK